MKKGTIKFFNQDKGFGFITAEDGTEVFFHLSGLSSRYKNPKKGNAVEFDITEGKKGDNAVNIDKV